MMFSEVYLGLEWLLVLMMFKLICICIYDNCKDIYGYGIGNGFVHGI